MTIPRSQPARLAFLLSLLSLAPVLVAPLRAQEPAPRERPAGYERLGAPVALHEVEGGSLLLATEADGVYLPAPGLATDVTIRVSGLVARAEVRQRFHNPTTAWVEGIYVFPLPEGAAVDGLRMRIGERVIEGQVREREEAAEVYRRAAREGRRASLVEQERPNLFTTSVANLGPEETVEVVLRYQQELRYDSGRFTLRFPLVAAPRYVPAPRPGPVHDAVVGAARTMGGPPLVAAVHPLVDTLVPATVPAVPDARRLAAPVARPEDGPVNPVRLTVELDAGFAVDRLGSASHVVDLARAGRGAGAYPAYRVTLAEGAVPADRDFVLEWAPAVGSEPGTALFTEEVDGETYALLMVLPPAVRRTAVQAPPREAVFVIDTSGSMHGESLAQAKAALRFALGRLRPQDRFNVIRFHSTAERLFPESLPAGGQTLEEAGRFVDLLRAEGGTEMLPALRLALGSVAGGLDPAPGTVRQVVFITDGAVGNEAELLAHVRRHVGESRLFTVGIGSAPNGHFMRRAAEEGRGTFTYVGRIDDVGPMMEELFAKLESPVLTGVELQWSDPAAEAWPERPPDLYAGEPVVVAARLPSGPDGGRGTVELSGFLDGRAWRVRRGLGGGAPRSGVARLWARRKIAALMAPGEAARDPGEVRAAVVEVALRHHLVSPFTSLVAVDLTPARPATEAMRSRRLPVSLPAGWSAEHAVGTLPQGSTAGSLLLATGLVLLLLAGTAAGRGRRGAGRAS